MMGADDFVEATHAQLEQLAAHCAKVRRNRPNHPWCNDTGACKHCAAIRDAHARIDDYLDQLDGREPPEDPDPVDTSRITSRSCGHCGLTRFSSLRGAIICAKCDGLPSGVDTIWRSLNLEDDQS